MAGDAVLPRIDGIDADGVSGLRILRASDRVGIPWKNGGGVTSELAVFPPGASFEDFGWRVSIARVERGGPFSVFPGIDRRIGLFEGAMLLSVGQQAAARLTPETEPLAFPGDAETVATLIAAPVTDLNVMTRRGVFEARMERRRIEGAVTFDARITTLVFPLSAVSIMGNATAELVSRDALLVEPGEQVAISVGQAVDCYWIEISAVR